MSVLVPTELEYVNFSKYFLLILEVLESLGIEGIYSANSEISRVIHYKSIYTCKKLIFYIEMKC